MMHLLPKILKEEHTLLPARKVHQDQWLAAVRSVSMVSLHHQTGGNKPCQGKSSCIAKLPAETTVHKEEPEKSMEFALR